MPHRFLFDPAILTSVAGGKSVIDLPKLAIYTEEQATAFAGAYGFSFDTQHDIDRLWYFHRRALVLLEEKLGFSSSEVPEELYDKKKLGDIRKLLMYASSVHPNEKELQRWACAILRVMHVFVHSESDLFASFSEEIQKQILSPFQSSIFTEGTTGTTYLKAAKAATVPVDGTAVEDNDEIALDGFEIKPFKTSASTVIKLLAKPDAVAMRVFDKLGVRFITKSMFDTFRVIRFLINHNLVSFPHIMPDQSSNNLYPAELFCEVCSDLTMQGGEHTDSDLERIFQQRLEEKQNQILWLRKENSFSGDDYRFIKFIARKLIRVNPEGKGPGFSFFFPYEVQVLDQQSYAKIQSGPSHHQQYKDRQKLAARVRLFPDLKEKEPAVTAKPETSEQ